MAVADVLVPGARGWYAPYPVAGASSILPDRSSVAYGANWVGFTDMGILSSPLSINFTDQEFALDTQASAAEVGAWRVSEQTVSTGVLTEWTPAILGVLLPGNVTTTAAATGVKGSSVITFGGNTLIPYYTIGFEGFRPDVVGNKQPIRIFFLRCQFKLVGTVVMGKNQNMGVPFRLKTFVDPTEVLGAQTLKIHVVTAPALP